MKRLKAVREIVKVCTEHTKIHNNCVGCIFFRNTCTHGGSGCIMQTAPCEIDIDLVEINILMEEQY